LKRANERKARREERREEREEHKTYVVKSGDTLSEIGARFGVDWRDIARINHVENPDLIFPGQKFKIPNK
ncbi:MAG TPA: LysM domain-containing protein, partial [Marmoricola sp.]|nr:LysM domain-containing protein [Marmoricola sp.]